ncbi:MAG: LptA/OstA family protein [Desulfobacterales bacterium]
MKLHRNLCRSSNLLAMILFSVICGFFFQPPVFGEDHQDKKHPFQAIRVVTDEAVMDSRAGHTDFIGNVNVDIDDTTITADRMRINFKAGRNNESGLSMDRDSIHEIVAKGNVVIRFDDKVAKAGSAVYTPDTDTLMLTGESTKISSGDDYITGKKIILDRANGTYRVESAGSGQVEAVFHQKQDRE